MDVSLQLRIAAIFEIFVVSLSGVCLPLYLVNVATKLSGEPDISKTLKFRALKTFSGGLVLSVAFCHLIADSLGDLSDGRLVPATPE